MRHENVNWELPEKLVSWEQVNTAILMDIRDELRTLNRVFQCSNFLRIPSVLNEIRLNTSKPKRKKKS